jgi:hypothetical protein
VTHSEIAAHEDKDAAASSRLGVDCGDGVLDLLHGEVLEESRCLRGEEMAPSMGLHVGTRSLFTMLFLPWILSFSNVNME